MNTNHRRSAFTLIEVLIIVIIMALLAATIISQFSSSALDAKKSSLDFNLHTMRSLIEMYKAHHNGAAPTSDATFTNQMTKKTDIDGTVNESTGKYGPYIQGKIPMNPYSNLNGIVAGTGTAYIDSTTAGWQYDATNANIFPNHSGYDYINQTQP
jgi:general secretion pathway protein G